MKSEALGAEAGSVESNNTHAKMNEECTIINNNLKSHAPANHRPNIVNSPKTEPTHGSDNMQRNAPKQREKVVDKFRRFVYFKGFERRLYNYFERQPSKMQKEIDQAAAWEVERIQLAGVDLRVITYTAKQTASLPRLASVDSRPESTSLPHAVTRRQERQA